MNSEIEKFVKLVVPSDCFRGFDFLVRIVGQSREEVLAEVIPVEGADYYEKRRDIANHLLGHPRFRSTIKAEALAVALGVLHGEDKALELMHKYRFKTTVTS